MIGTKLTGDWDVAARDFNSLSRNFEAAALRRGPRASARES